MSVDRRYKAAMCFWLCDPACWTSAIAIAQVKTFSQEIWSPKKSFISHIITVIKYSTNIISFRSESLQLIALIIMLSTYLLLKQVII